jgi:hypothetical protein
LKTLAPLGDDPLNRYVARARLIKHQAQVLADIAREVGGNVKEERARKTFASPAGDEQKLRGIPAISRGTSGCIRGTDPERELIRREEQAALRPMLRLRVHLRSDARAVQG